MFSVLSLLASHEPHAYEHTDNTDRRWVIIEEIHAAVLLVAVTKWFIRARGIPSWGTALIVRCIHPFIETTDK